MKCRNCELKQRQFYCANCIGIQKDNDKSHPPSNPRGGKPTSQSIQREYKLSSRRATLTLSTLITRARAGLVQELVEVFNIVQVGGRPPLGGKAGSQGEWTIAVHFVGLLAFYLGVKLPFVVNWDGGKLGVGVPWIGPGLDGWGRQVLILWPASHPLHLSLSPSPAPTASGSPSAPHFPTEDLSLSQSLSQSQLSQSTATLRPEAAAAAPEPEPPHFTTALVMLLYDVMYLAHTQGLALPLAQAGDILGNLWAVCCAPELGRRSHATYTTVTSLRGSPTA
ncbi:hypothetical protein C8R46DRAFT_1300611 [Mycena filopes]|nr:hypothetical protein C8R46DRAFT_1300611 [Mycena filopes]